MPDTSDSDINPPSKHSPLLVVVVVVLLLLVLYPLSLGPYVGYVARRSGGVRADDLWFYQPLVRLAEHSKVVKRTLDSYMRLFL